MRCLASTILPESLFRSTVPCMLSKNLILRKRDFEILILYDALSNTCSDVTRIPNIHKYFYIITQQMGEQTLILFSPTQFLLHFFWPHI